MYYVWFRKFIASVAPHLPTKRIELAEKIFVHCMKNREDIMISMDKKFTELGEISSVIATEFFKKVADENNNIKIYNICGKIKENGKTVKIEDRHYPFIFDEKPIEIEFKEQKIDVSSIKFIELLDFSNGVTRNREGAFVCETYALLLCELLKKKADKIFDDVITEYTKDILKYPYWQYEDIKEYVNLAIYNNYMYLSLVHYLKDMGDFIEFAQWTDKTVGEVLNL